MGPTRRGLFAGFVGVVGLLLGRKSARGGGNAAELLSLAEGEAVRDAVARCEEADRDLEEFRSIARGGLFGPDGILDADGEAEFDRKHREWVSWCDRRAESTAKHDGKVSLTSYYTERERLTRGRLAELERLRRKGLLPWPHCSH